MWPRAFAALYGACPPRARYARGFVDKVTAQVLVLQSYTCIPSVATFLKRCFLLHVWASSKTDLAQVQLGLISNEQRSLRHTVCRVLSKTSRGTLHSLTVSYLSFSLGPVWPYTPFWAILGPYLVRLPLPSFWDSPGLLNKYPQGLPYWFWFSLLA